MAKSSRFSAELVKLMMFIRPCIALEPYLAEEGPFITSNFSAFSKLVSNRPFTLQNPLGLVGIPSSKIKKEPQAPGPVRTGDLIEVKCSCPDPLLIQTLGIWLRILLGCTGFVFFILSSFST